MLYFAEPAGRIAFEKFAKKFTGSPADETIVTNALRSVEMFLDVAERLLRQNEYMAGDDFTLVDIYYIPLVQRLFDCGYGHVIVRREAVNAWWNRCVTRPAIQKLLAADKEAMAAAAKRWCEKLVSVAKSELVTTTEVESYNSYLGSTYMCERL